MPRLNPDAFLGPVVKNNQFRAFDMPGDGCIHFYAFYDRRAYLEFSLISNEEDIFENNLVANLSLQTIHFDRGSFDGAVLLAATFYNCVFHPVLLQSSLRRVPCAD